MNNLVHPILHAIIKYKSIVIDLCLAVIICIPVWFKIYHTYPHNTDLIVYTGLIFYIQEQGDVRKMHEQTYVELLNYFPVSEQPDILGKDKNNKQNLHDDPLKLLQALSIGIIKPLYILFLWIFHLLFNMPVVVAAKLINSVGLYGMVTILIKMMVKWPKYFRFIFLFVCFNIPAVQNIFCLCIPDILSSVILLIAFYYVLIEFQFWLSIFWFGLGILVRPELIILVVFCLVLLFGLKLIAKNKFIQAFLILNSLCLLVAALPHILYESSLNPYLLFSKDFDNNAYTYLDLFFKHLHFNKMMAGLVLINLGVFFSGSVSILFRGVSMVLIVFMILRYILQPFMENRFYLLPYLVTIVLIYTMFSTSIENLTGRFFLSSK